MKELLIFKDLFGQGSTKFIGDSMIEFRIKGDLDVALSYARRIISKHGLNLTARTTGTTSSYGAFEVIINS
ncbi:hypothetical protein [Albibacterium profundi]|uniref:Uncharacterized protein n=1 Tax=Albibacterium profundi TaxID=3134906 RepID=A0ABV5CEX9_9SPHI